MGRLEPRSAIRMQIVQCTTIALFILFAFVAADDRFVVVFAIVYSTLFGSAFLIPLIVSFGVLRASQVTRDIQLPELNIKA
ncbi:hypothetical protein E4T47_09350 [Aureobasidium subglaciale]|nr:hypothetical protein E4T47_09350 [Aureobasidium subglaciale]